MNAPLPGASAMGDGAAVLARARLSIPGMHCAGCIAKVERLLGAADGVYGARVDFSEKSVAIDHDAAQIDVPQLVRTLEQNGFAAHPILTLDEAADSADAAAARHHAMLLSALGVAAFASMNIMLLSVSIWSGLAGNGRTIFHWLSAAIAVPTVIWSGRPFFQSAWGAVRHGRTNMDVPISIAVLLTTGMSLYETATHGPHAWFDGAVMLLFFLLGGRVLDSMMRERARAGASALMAAGAAGAMLVDGTGRAVWHAASAIRAGDMMLVAAGERLAADGVLIDAAARIDQSILTGEAASIPFAKGQMLLAGMLNLDAPIRVVARAVGDDRRIAELARAMRDAGQQKSRYVRIADRAARLYTPVVHALAALGFLGWMVAGAGAHQSLLVAVAVLLITCPCALGLAVPVAQVVASGALMRSGLLVKDGSALERLAECDMVLLDKTGTLTLGRPVPQSLDGLDATARAVALALAQASSHPLSRGLARSLNEAGAVPADVSDIAETPGIGMQGLWQGQKVTLGRHATGQDAAQDVGMSVTLTIGDGAAHVIVMEDVLRPDATAALGALRSLGMPQQIISGDGAAAVAKVAQALTLSATATADPDAKLALIERLRAEGKRVLMVGDGLNDGPALAAAHASIAPSSASDVGQQAADMVFMGDSLNALPRAVRAARMTQRVVRSNFMLAIIYNVIAVPMAMAGWVTPLVAAVAMSSSSLIVVANSLRLVRAAR